MKSNKTAVFLVCYISYVAIYVARLNLSIASPALIEGGVLTAVQIGFLGSAFSVVYSCGRLLNGWLSDRMAPSLFIFVGLLFTGIANLCVGLLPPYIPFLLLLCLNAIAQSMLWSAMLRTISSAYGKEHADKKVSLLVSSVSAGNVAAIPLNTWLVEQFGVRAAFFLPGTLTLVMCMLSAWILRMAPTTIQNVQKPKARFRKPDPRLLAAIAPAAFHGVMKENISLWMAVFFTDRFAIDLKSSAWFVMLIPLIGFAGRLLFPFCYKLCRRNEQLLTLISFVLCAGLAAVLCLNLNAPLVAALCLSLIYALVSIINTSLISIFPLRFADSGSVASVSGLMDFITYLGAGISSAIYGVFVADHTYTPMFLSWVVLSALSVPILLWQMKPEKK